MKFTKSLTVILAFVLAGSALGFDGNRKGFVLGGGLGFAPLVHWELASSPSSDVSEGKAGAAVQILIGGAFDEHNMLVYEAKIAAISSGWTDDDIGQGFERRRLVPLLRSGRQNFLQHGRPGALFLSGRGQRRQ